MLMKINEQFTIQSMDFSCKRSPRGPFISNKLLVAVPLSLGGAIRLHL